MKKYINKVNIILVILLLISSILLLLNLILDFQVPAEYNPGISENTTKSLQKGDKIEIITTSRISNLEALQLEMIPTEENANIDGMLEKEDGFVSIYDENDELIYYNDLSEIQVFDNHELYLKFDKIKDSNNKKYKIVIEINENLDHKLFKLTKTSQNSKLDKAIINEEKTKDDITVIQHGTTTTTFYRVVFMIIICILTFILFRYNFKNNENIKSFLLKKKKVFILEFILSLIASFSYLKVVYEHYFCGTFDVMMYGLFAFATLLIIAILGIFLGNKELKREDLFLLIAIPISTLFLTFILPLNVPDELYHYKIATKVSMFHFFNQDIMIPKNLHEFNLYSLFNTNISYQNLISEIAGGYHPILYIFSGFSIRLSKILQFNPIIGFYIGRCANLILYLIISYYAVKKIPMGKFLMIIYLLNPMFLQQATSYSADALTNISSMLFIAYVLYIKYDKKKVETKDFVTLLMGFMFVLVGKYAYFLLGLLFILIWKELKEYIKAHKKKVIIIVLLIAIIGLSWFIYTKIPKDQIIDTINYERPQSTESKLMHILKNPQNIIPIYLNTLLYNSNFYLITFLGGTLGALNIPISQIYTLIYAAILVLSIFVDKEKHELDKKSKIINIIIFILTFHIVLAGLYLGWGVITDPIIQGVQGRYFIPIVILLLLAMVRKKNINLKNIEIPMLIILLINNLLIIRDVIIHFLV